LDQDADEWSNTFLNLFGFEWSVKEPGGRTRWVARPTKTRFPDAMTPSKKHRPTMLTTDLSLRFDPAYGKFPGGSCHRSSVADAFARAGKSTEWSEGALPRDGSFRKKT